MIMMFLDTVVCASAYLYCDSAVTVSCVSKEGQGTLYLSSHFLHFVNMESNQIKVPITDQSMVLADAAELKQR